MKEQLGEGKPFEEHKWLLTVSVIVIVLGACSELVSWGETGLKMSRMRLAGTTEFYYSLAQIKRK